MAEICCNPFAAEGAESSGSDTCGRVARKRRMELRRVRGVPATVVEGGEKLRLLEVGSAVDGLTSINKEKRILDRFEPIPSSSVLSISSADVFQTPPKFGMTSMCGRRRDMEDAVAIHPSFHGELHYFAVYDGHGCSHVSSQCREKLHELVKEELAFSEDERCEHVSNVWWSNAMERSFSRMDKQVVDKSTNDSSTAAHCRCELKVPECDIVGSTAVVSVVTSGKIIVANCGDSRAVLSRNGNSIPLSNDHKPDRPDELKRIESAGGRVIFWYGARVLGVLAMSRAIGDSYLKPYVTSQPEVTIIDRTKEDEFLILASDGLWDVVSNDTACGVARMCLMGKVAFPKKDIDDEDEDSFSGTSWNKPCVDASMLLTKLALSRQSSDNISVVVIDLRLCK